MPKCRGCSRCPPEGKSDYINLQGCFACNSLVLSFYLIVYAKAAAAVVRKAAHQSSKKVGRGEEIGEEDLASEDWEASNLVGSSEGRGGRGGRGERRGKGAGGGGSSSSSSSIVSGDRRVIPFAKKEVGKAVDSLIAQTTKGNATAHEVEDVPV
jgi:hypothetical protein